MNLIDALIAQESGGRPGVPGQWTKWGRPMGLTQMLPATAQETARKIGLPWSPALLSGKTPDAAAYQKQLGEAYLNEGLDKTGNPRDALRYYHGGPNKALWGPKTNAYADQVLARVNGDQQVPKPTLASLMAPQAPMFGVDPQAPMQTLGSLALPQPDVPEHKGLFPGKDWKTLASIALGAIGDGLVSANGGQPMIASMFRDRQRQDAEDKQARERLAAQIEAKRQEAMQPPQFVQNLQAWMQLPDQLKRQYAQYQDIVNPIAVSGPQGTQRVPRTVGPQPGSVEDGYVFLGGDPADKNNWRPQ
jgi:hypothetical protein